MSGPRETLGTNSRLLLTEHGRKRANHCATPVQETFYPQKMNFFIVVYVIDSCFVLVDLEDEQHRGR